MSQKRKSKWFKSAFSEENEKDTIPSKILRKSQSLNASSISEGKSETIDLAFDDDIDGFSTFLNNCNTKSNGASQCRSLSNGIENQNEQKLQTINWLELFTPQSIDDLAIHPKKITEIQDWFKHYENIKKKFPGQMLLVSGPSGCGKTTTIRTLAKNLNYELIEWITPVDTDISVLNNNFNSEKNYVTFESQSALFKRFLFRSSRYKSVFDINSNKRIILVEDFPNIFLRDPNEFHSILSDYSTFGRSALIFIATDSRSRDLNLGHTLFPDQIKSQYNIGEISFNPISTTLMKKALKIICTKLKEQYLKKKSNIIKIPSDDILDNINITAQGDIRNAILNLHLVALKGVPELQKELTKIKSTTNKKNKTKKLKSIGRDETVTLMHALGRVMYPKYNSVGKSKNFVHSPEEIADAFTTEARNFLNLIHSNYLSHFKCVEDTVTAAECLSLSDNLMNEYRIENCSNIGLNLGIRGVMASNENSTGSWAPIKGIYKQNQKNNFSNVDNLRNELNLSNKVFMVDFHTYAKIIFGGTSSNT